VSLSGSSSLTWRLAGAPDAFDLVGVADCPANTLHQLGREMATLEIRHVHPLAKSHDTFLESGPLIRSHDDLRHALSPSLRSRPILDSVASALVNIP
jgi:hypothetical protein